MIKVVAVIAKTEVVIVEVAKVMFKVTMSIMHVEDKKQNVNIMVNLLFFLFLFSNTLFLPLFLCLFDSVRKVSDLLLFWEMFTSDL